MKFFSRKQTSQQSGAEGLLLMLAAVPFIFAGGSEVIWQNILGGLAALFCLLAAWCILRKPEPGKILAGMAATCCIVSLWPIMVNDPSIALMAVVVYIFAIYNLGGMDRTASNLNRNDDDVEIGLQRTRWAALTLTGISLACFLIIRTPSALSNYSLLAIAALAQLLSIIWSIYQQSNFHKMFSILLNTLTLMAAFYLANHGLAWFGGLIIGTTLLLFLPQSAHTPDSFSWFDFMINHPARATLFTFLMLCLLGVFLLYMPIAAADRQISLIDAAFTAVSAVCVTGLIVLDTPNDFSSAGQAFILLLIQLGGLGIMTVTTLALHTLGRRISIKQAKVLNITINSDHVTLIGSLKQIAGFTAVSEIFGAITLTVLFLNAGIGIEEAIWKGVFTSVSAFCNAGFALQSDSLIGFQNYPMILHTVAFLIVIGGLAPAVVMMIPAWFRGHSLPAAARLALLTTIVLLFSGSLFYLLFEWDNSLKGLSIANRLHNAWFQSVTLRTAGFNSVAIENVISPTFIIMLCMMFIGGSPGGTAGGIKTTTFGVLIATFWSCVLGYEEVAIQNRKVMHETIFKAITTVVAGIGILLAIVLMLEVTQTASSRDLIFEATSALGTVGLSFGATTKLDSIGKIIIMLAMFAGRIGPVTLFALLSRERHSNAANYLDARINLT
ncbi:MAG: potassium transporter TrkH [Candidatus Riflebacteria bacterium HGW-Riflebacteria-2]|jgi:trk system potassium uptake protein TrkH|nr:MAG: potassium transporter TrkH [Candidatus Riflebacteria bacterium HGW-Riflebacteria-2]